MNRAITAVAVDCNACGSTLAYFMDYAPDDEAEVRCPACFHEHDLEEGPRTNQERDA